MRECVSRCSGLKTEGECDACEKVGARICAVLLPRFFAAWKCVSLSPDQHLKLALRFPQAHTRPSSFHSPRNDGDRAPLSRHHPFARCGNTRSHHVLRTPAQGQHALCRDLALSVSNNLAAFDSAPPYISTMAAPRTPSAAPPPIHLHSRVKVSNLGHGEVLFVGQTSFAAGVWVGIALDHSNGKNNGSVQGKRYFECDDGYGVFVRSSQVHVLSPEEEMHSVDDEPVAAPAPAPRAARPSAAATPSSAAAARLSPRKNPAATPARPAASRSSLAPGATPASAVRRTSAVSSASASSSASSSRPPTAAGAAARLGSPVKSTTGMRSPVKSAGIDLSIRPFVCLIYFRTFDNQERARKSHGLPSTPAAPLHAPSDPP